jgi:predicted RNase H-like nuclease (RuvC/YqgF family)
MEGARARVEALLEVLSEQESHSIWEWRERNREKTEEMKRRSEHLGQTLQIFRKKNASLGRDLEEMGRRRGQSQGRCALLENGVFQRAKALSQLEDEVTGLEAEIDSLEKGVGVLRSELEEKRRVGPSELLLGIYEGFGVEIFVTRGRSLLCRLPGRKTFRIESAAEIGTYTDEMWNSLHVQNNK